MTRERIKTLLVALLAVFTLGSIAEAAPKRVVRHRPRHSTRVAAGTTSAVKKKTTKTKPAARRATQTPPSAKRRPTTKPR
jgi:pyrroline-5-carboxylate reductase